MQCAKCAVELPPQTGMGRPRKFCDAHRKLGYQPRQVVAKSCAECGESFAPFSVRSRYCSDRCRWRARDKARGFPCSECGKAMYRSREAADTPTCHDCRRARPGYKPRGPKPPERWACAGCGANCERPATKGQRPKWCDDCRRLGNTYVPLTVRRAVYERDEWVCWLCEEPVDASLIGARSDWSPSLDHVIPRSQGGDDSPENLRLAHFWCNSVRSDERAYMPEDFRVSA